MMTREDCLRALESTGGNRRKAAKKLGISPRTLRRRLNNETPMSESKEKFHKHWTEEDCIDELQKIARQYPDKVITRNFFRTNANISEATWNRYFGTFEEFKRQAGITLTRQQHMLEKQLAKHASVDHYRDMNRDREAWGERYKRDSGKRFQMIMTLSDLHDKHVDPFWLRVAIDTAKRAQPDVIILNGDVFDLPEFGRFHVDPRQWDVVGRIQFVHKMILKPLREACPDAELIFVEGNHEYRLLRHLADATPAMQAVLSDLHGMTVPKLLGLTEFEVRYIAKADLAAYTVNDMKAELKKNYCVKFDCFLAHHHPEGMRMGLPGTNGHNHKFMATPQFSHIFGAYTWVQTGCGHVLDATYCDAAVKWNMGFLLSHIDTEKKSVNQEYVPVSDLAVVGGQYYHRNST